MSLNIKNERTHALVRELAARTGRSQTSAVEDAVRARLAELDAQDDAHAARAAARSEALRAVLRDNPTETLDADRAAFRRIQEDLYDAQGLPRS